MGMPTFFLFLPYGPWRPAVQRAVRLSACL